MRGCLVTLSQKYYDTYDTTQGVAGDGDLTRTIQYPTNPGTNAVTGDARVSDFYYDWRDRQVASKAGVKLSASGTPAASL